MSDQTTTDHRTGDTTALPAAGAPAAPGSPAAGETPVGDRPPAERSVAELLGDLSQQLTSLMHQELELAKVELSQKSRRMGVGAGLLGAAGALAYLALGALVACAVAALSGVLSVWLSALLVGAGLLMVAVLLALIGRSETKRGTPPIPHEAIESTKEDAAWLKTQISSARP